MKQHVSHPRYDQVLEFEVPDDAVHLAPNGQCPACGGNQRVTEINVALDYYKCVGPGYTRRAVPVTHHDGIPPVRWYVGFPERGEPTVHVETVVRPRVIDGGEHARSQA